MDADAGWVRLTYAVNGHPMDYYVRLVSTLPSYGGRRWWFLCPLERQDGRPLRRVAKLYAQQQQPLRIATVDQDATIIESHKEAALAHYDDERG